MWYLMTRSMKFKSKIKIKLKGIPVGRAVTGSEQTVVHGNAGPAVVAH